MRTRFLIWPVLLLALGLLAGCSSGFAPAQGPQPGKPAPDFRLPQLDGQAVSLSDYRGHPVLLNFWASWCGPCRYEMPFLQQVHEDERWSASGLVILAVDIGESPDTVAQFMAENGLSFAALLDTSQDVALQYNVRNIPTTFLIDADGVIRDIKVGAFSGKDEIERRLGKIVP